MLGEMLNCLEILNCLFCCLTKDNMASDEYEEYKE